MINSTTPSQPSIAQLSFLHAQKVSRADGTNFSNDILYLQGNPEITSLRDYWGADIVMMLTKTGTPNACGQSAEPSLNSYPAPGPDFAQFAAGVILYSCSLSTYAFAHELGHIFGANHDTANNGNTTPLEPWAFAHVSNVGSFKTIMASPSACPSCAYVLNYSNALVYLDGFPTGVANQKENARIISEFASATAQYRASLGRIFADRFE